MAKFLSDVFGEDRPQSSETGSEYQPLDGGDPVDPGNPVASEYQPLDGGDPVDPGNPVASEFQPLGGSPTPPDDGISEIA